MTGAGGEKVGAAALPLRPGSPESCPGPHAADIVVRIPVCTGLRVLPRGKADIARPMHGPGSEIAVEFRVMHSASSTRSRSRMKLGDPRFPKEINSGRQDNRQAEPRPEGAVPVTYLITFACYGCHMHGDESVPSIEGIICPGAV